MGKAVIVLVSPVVQTADDAKQRKKYKPTVRALKVRIPSHARRAVAEMAIKVWMQLAMLRSIMNFEAIVIEPTY